MDAASFALSVSDMPALRRDLAVFVVAVTDIESLIESSSRFDIGAVYKQVLADVQAHGVSTDDIQLIARRVTGEPFVEVTGLAFGPRRRVTPFSFDAAHVQPWFDELFASLAAERKVASEDIANVVLEKRIGVSLGDLRHRELFGESFDEWLREHIPQSWKAAEDKAAKKALLKDLHQGAPAVVFEAEDIASAWSDLVAHTSVVTRAPVSKDELQRFNAAAGFAMPPQLEVLLGLSNGASQAFGFRDLLSCDGILMQWSSWKQIFDERTLAQLRSGSAAADDRTIGIYTNPRWVPFASGSGNSIAIDLLPGPAGKRGQVIYFGSDESHNVRVIADDLATFIKLYLEADPQDPNEGF